MCKTQWVLALVALYVGLAHSWVRFKLNGGSEHEASGCAVTISGIIRGEGRGTATPRAHFTAAIKFESNYTWNYSDYIAVSQGDELIFFANGSKTDTVRFKSQNLTALAYDEVHTTMLYVDKQNENDAICAYNLLSKENKCYIKRIGSNIHSIAYDLPTETLFFTDTNERSINCISLTPGSNNNVNLLIKMDDRIPNDIAVDTCRGYIYWINRNVTNGEYMERCRLNGSQREVVFQGGPVSSLAIDPRKIYFCQQSDFWAISWNKVWDTKYISSHSGNHSKPQELSVSNDNLYWIITGVNYTTVWQVAKNRDQDKPKLISLISKFNNKIPLNVVANYKIKDQIQGLEDCEVLWRLMPKIHRQTIEFSRIARLFCVHGLEVGDTSVCKCTPGYIGERCDVSVCENYCLQGDCSFRRTGLSECRCNLGYSGERCEVYACHGFCLNNGDCSINEKSEPVCQCKRDYVGDKCEISVCRNYCIQGQCSFTQEGLPTCRCNAGYSGEKCEVYACHDYCLNSGVCSLNADNEPICQCVGNHEGTRCETVKYVSINNIPTYNSAKRNLTVGDLLTNWRQLTSKNNVTV